MTTVEGRLLLSAARGMIGPVREEAPIEPSDADRLRTLAEAHGLIGVLHRRCGCFATEARAQVQRNLFLAGELLRLLDVLRRGGVRALVMKGPVLAVECYGDLGLRAFRDLDLLVERDRVLDARRLLEGAGLVTEDPPPASRVEAFLGYGHEFVLRRPDAPTQVGLHWRLAPRAFTLDLDLPAMWARRREVPIGGRAVETFDPADTLLALTIHGTRHGWEELKYVLDVALLLARHPGLDVESCVDRARRSGCLRILHLGVLLAVDLLGAPAPPGLAAAARADRAAGRLATTVAPAIIEPARRETIVRRLLFHLRVRERRLDRVRGLLRLVLTPTIHDWSFVALPPALSPLYLLVRPFRLAGRHLVPHRSPTG